MDGLIRELQVGLLCGGIGLGCLVFFAAKSAERGGKAPRRSSRTDSSETAP